MEIGTPLVARAEAMPPRYIVGQDRRRECARGRSRSYYSGAAERQAAFP